MNSAAEVIYQFLLDAGLADDSGGGWPLHISFMPNLPNVAICVYDTAGEKDGRIMQGSTIEHHGIQVVIRNPLYDEGWRKARAIADAFDNQVKTSVAVDSASLYTLHDVSRRGLIIPVGVDEQDGQRRHYFTINAVVTYAQVTTDSVDPVPELEPPAPGVWYRADFGVTLLGVQAVNGGLVDQWNDKSGNGYEAVQASAAQQPTYNTNVLNGHPVLHFPRTTNQLLTIPSSAALLPPTNQAFSLFAVLRPTNFANAIVLFEGDTGGGFVQWYLDSSTGKQVFSDGNPSVASTTGLTAGAWNRIGVRVPTRGSGNTNYYLNGVANGVQSQGISGIVGSMVTSLMGDRPPFVFPLIGDIAEFLFYARDVTAGEIADIDAYFVDRYAL